eukprot:s1830_g27.t1
MLPKRILKPAPQVAPALPPASVRPTPSKLPPYFEEEAEAVKGLPSTPMEQIPEDVVVEDTPAPAQAVSALAPAIMLPPPPMAAASGFATPMSTGDDASHSPDAEDEHASRKARICMVAGVEHEHEDDHNYTIFTNTELDALEDFEFGLTGDDVGNEVPAEDALLHQLVFPYSGHEPKLFADKMMYLDPVGMQVETARLNEVGVLLLPEIVEELSPKRLSTRYVITRRDEVIDGKTCLETYALGHVLPGQRDGSQLWFESVNGFLKEKLGFEHCDAYPSLLRGPGDECLILLHVDDLLVVTEQQSFDGKLIPTLTAKYKASVHCMSQAGDTFEFLKRIHVLVADEAIHAQQNSGQFDKLFEVVGVQNTVEPQESSMS